MPAYTKIKCELCAQEVSKSNYTKHLRRHREHPETFKETYKLDHTGLNCKFCNKQCKNTNSLIQHEMRCKSNPNRIEIVISKFNSGRSAWNKGLSKETDERVLKQAIAQTGKIGLRGDANPARRPEVRKKISDTCLRKSQEGTWHTSLAKDHHINYKECDFHSTWEVEYAKYLDAQNIKWLRTTDRFPYNYQESLHYYTPDFYLPETDEYVEIKGYSTGKDYAKWKQFPENKILKVLKYQDLIDLGLQIKI